MFISVRQKLILFVVGANILLSIILAISIYNVTYNSYLKSFFSNKLNLARTIALSIDGNYHGKMRSQDAKKEQEYKRYLNYLNEVKQNDEYISYLYTLGYDRLYNQFYYTFDADLAQENILWIETPLLKIEFHFGKDSMFFMENNRVYKNDFKLKIKDKKIHVQSQKTDSSINLLLDGKVFASVLSVEQAKVRFFECLLDSGNTYCKTQIQIKEQKLEAVVSLSITGESVSDPGVPMQDDSLAMANLKKIFYKGKDHIDTVFIESIYGKSISAYGIIKDSKNETTGLVCIEILENELAKFRSKITRTAILITLGSLVLLIILLPLLFEFIIIIKVRKLKGGIDQIAKGNLDTNIHISSKDEFELLANGFNGMSHNLKISYENLKDEIAISTSLHKNIQAPFFETNKEGMITYINAEAAKIIGTEIQTVLHQKKAFEIFGHKQQILDTLLGETYLNLQTSLLGKKGERIPVIMNSGTIKNRNSEIIGAFVMFTDLSELTELKDLNNKLTETNRTITEQNQLISSQKEELQTQNDEISAQKTLVEETNLELNIEKSKVEKSKRKILDSIIYAERIQYAILPEIAPIEEYFTETMLLFLPRDIVSGDFYYFSKYDKHLIIGAADCTGHGVPGAFMSVLGVTLMNDIVNVSENNQCHEGEFQCKECKRLKFCPANILNQLRYSVKTSLSQTGAQGESRDGMDIALCSIDTQNWILQYAGAHHPFYLLRNGELIEYRADPMPVGVHRREDPFTNHVIQLQKDDTFFIFSDGYCSQFNEEGIKMKRDDFKEILIQNIELPLNEIKVKLLEYFYAYKGKSDQIDDILLLGFRV